MSIIRVLVPKIALFPLEYKSKFNHKVGDLVVVPLQNKNITGIVWEVNCRDSGKKLKSVDPEIIFPCSVSDKVIDLIKKASNYYIAKLGTVAKLVLPVDINESPLKIEQQKIKNKVHLAQLSEDQQKVLESINQEMKPTILKGATGSGKTEVYFYAIWRQLQLGNQAIIMLPEIALSSQIISRFRDRFGFDPVIWNSSVTKAKKKRILRGIISGEVKIVIGARSALFLPYKKLGLIVVDEEHDASYKQNDGILYNARDMAVLRGKIEKCRVLLISATPSIESLYNVELGKYDIALLENRYNDAYLPDVKIIDMRQHDMPLNSWVSEPAINAIRKNIGNKQQTLIFLNRRGYAPLMLCKACGYRENCKKCSSSMVVHKELNRMKCHHCGAISVIHTACQECNKKDSLILCGPGIERIHEEIAKIFPEANSVIVSKDQTARSEDIQEILHDMENSKIDILIGTQVVTKGYHFPNLTLVLVIDADLGLIGGDLRSSEKTFQLLQQVGGRAGRADKKGTVLMQTYYPDNKVIKAISGNREDLFIKEELSSRKNAFMPPFSKIAAITVTGKNPEKTLQMAKLLAANAPQSSAKIMGPAEAMILKLSGRYRYKILVVVERNFNLQKYLKLWQEQTKIPSSYQVKFDIDPHNFM